MHIRNVEEQVRGKADREMVQRGLNEQVVNLSAVDAKQTEATALLAESSRAHQQQVDTTLASLDDRATSLEADIVTKVDRSPRQIPKTDPQDRSTRQIPKTDPQDRSTRRIPKTDP